MYNDLVFSLPLGTHNNRLEAYAGLSKISSGLLT
jgi:hypothetical protein